MDARAFRPYLVLIALFAVASLALAFTVDVDAPPEAGVEPALPDQVGEWAGTDIRYCQNREHGRAWDLQELRGASACPDCHGPIGTMTWVERDILPADTTVVKKRYQEPDGRIVHASIVLSGRDGSGIHRAEDCQTGGGGRIEWIETISVDRPDGTPLEVRVLDISRRVPGPRGQLVDHHSYYAYWFVGRNRETASHFHRKAYMYLDRIFLGVAHQWAYISVGGVREPGSRAHLDEIREFIEAFYPQIRLAGAAPADG